MQVVSFVLGALLVFGICGAFFAGTLALLKSEQPEFLDLLLWAIFLVWQFAPVLFEGYSPGLNFREVARYPVSFRTYFLLNAVYGASDPAALACLLWLLSMWVGILIAQPAWALIAVPAFLLFALFNLFCNRIIIGLFDRFQSTRKGRERMVAVMLVVMLLPQLLQLATANWTNFKLLKIPGWVLDVITPIRRMAPPGVVARALLLDGGEKLVPLLLLGFYSLVVWWLLRRQLRAVYEGEIYAEGYTVKRELKVQPGWRLPGVDEVISAIVEKELHYIRQNARMIVQFVYPMILFLFLSFSRAGKNFFFSRSSAGLLATHHDIARANDVDTIGGTTVINDHRETTLLGRQAGYLDGRADDVCARRKQASRRDRVGDGGRQGWITEVGCSDRVGDSGPINPFAWGEDF